MFKKIISQEIIDKKLDLIQRANQAYAVGDMKLVKDLAQDLRNTGYSNNTKEILVLLKNSKIHVLWDIYDTMCRTKQFSDYCELIDEIER